MKTFAFDKEYTVKGETCRYCGSAVFATFETLDRSKVIQVTDDELDAIKESTVQIDGSKLPTTTKAQTFDLPQGHYTMPPIEAVAYETQEKVADPEPSQGTPKNGRAHKIVEA